MKYFLFIGLLVIAAIGKGEGSCPAMLDIPGM